MKNLHTLTARYLILLFAGILLASSCSKSDSEENVPNKFNLSGISVPSIVTVSPGGDFEFSIKGVQMGDVIIFTPVDNAQVHYTASLKEIKSSSVIITVPADLSSNRYRLSIKRGEESKSLGVLTINVALDIQIPDKAGMNLKGAVTCNGEGVANVVVSDGVETTTTDNKGIYYLASQKKYGYVFISVPGGYAVSKNYNKPDFYQKISQSASTVQECNFALTPEENNHHVLFAIADWHLAGGKDDDLIQFDGKCIPDMNQLAQSYTTLGVPVYGVSLGDMSWDNYWYSRNYALPEYLVEMHKLNFPVYNTMGNHDNNPYKADDFLAEQAFRNYVGPTFYSYNLGKAHFIVLDDIEYINNGGSEGVKGERDYNKTIQASVIEWIKKDLSYITDKSRPIFVTLHAPVCGNPTLNSDGTQSNKVNLSNAPLLISALSTFPNVHILSGHTHINYTNEPASNIIEHNTAAICATWWYTGKNGSAGNHICCDGSVGGYGVYDINGNEVKWYYKSVGYAKDYQFRSYDLNKVCITAAAYCPNSTDAALAKYITDYGTQRATNEILINVFNYDTQWKIEVTENGAPLKVTRVRVKDPLHLISDEAMRLKSGSDPGDGNSCLTAHMFKVTASGATTPIVIKITDRFGNVYTENMIRPKALTYNMN